MKKTILAVILTTTVVLGAKAQNVNIPDANFKTYLLGNSLINTNSDNEIQVTEAAVFDGEISCPFLNIIDLTGIEAFTALTLLTCSSNALTSLDVSANTALTFLSCYNNQLTSLDVSANTALTKLYCYDNMLSSLDVSANAALTELRCINNQLSSLDVSANTALTELLCFNNHLTNLNISSNIALINLNCSDNQLTNLNLSTNTLLSGLTCSANQLTSLDVSTNTSLTLLRCGANQLTSLDISANLALTYLSCFSNQLSSLDVSTHSTLLNLLCSDNSLSTLNVKNGNNTAMYIEATNNPNLFCIEVDDASWSATNWLSAVDPIATFSENCFLGGVNDISFEKINFYPNPTNDIINFSVTTNVQLLSATGQILAEKKNTTMLDLSNQQPGIYFLINSDNKGQVMQRNKIVKE